MRKKHEKCFGKLCKLLRSIRQLLGGIHGNAVIFHVIHFFACFLEEKKLFMFTLKTQSFTRIKIGTHAYKSDLNFPTTLALIFIYFFNERRKLFIQK